MTGNRKPAGAVPTSTAEVARVAPGPLSMLMHGTRPPLILDVRPPEDFLGDLGHIEGASLFPLEQLGESLEELRGLGGRSFVLVGDDEPSAQRAAALMTEAGFSAVMVLEGGMRAWIDAGLPVRR